MSTKTKAPLAASILLIALCPWAGSQQNPDGLARVGTAKVQDTFVPLPPGDVKFTGGLLGARYDVNERNRLLRVDEQDLLGAFENRDGTHQVWQGEHVGKFLHAATLVWATTGDNALKAKIDRVAARLIHTQEKDGYLGTYPPAQRWTAWDVWAHKYDLLGLLTYYQYTHSKSALEASRRVGDLLVRTFGPGKRDINKAGEHMGMASCSVIEPMLLLYRATGDGRYLTFAKYIVANYDAPGGPTVVSSLQKFGRVDKVGNGKAYEMLSNFNGLIEMHRVTQDGALRRDAISAWSDIVANRRYVTGTASAGEYFRDDHVLPNGESSNVGEVCVTVTWEQMNLQLLRLTGDPAYADQMELTIYNHLLAAQKPTGEAWSYYTPLEGRKAYSPNTTCCLSSGARGVALLPSIAAMKSADGGLVINLYNSSTIRTRLPCGTVAVRQETDYPVSGGVRLTVNPETPGAFPLRLRIPSWARGTSVTVNGRPLAAARVRPGSYAVVNRRWKRGDSVSLNLPMPARLIRGDHGNDGLEAVMRGPVVYAVDTAQNGNIRMLKQVALAADNASQLKATATVSKALGSQIALRTPGSVAGANRDLNLIPFSFAGQDGASRYAVWIARPGHAQLHGGSGSLFYAAKVSVSRIGNQVADIADDDVTTRSVTWNDAMADEDWYALTLPKAVRIGRATYAHGAVYNNGGWFDASAGKPRIQVRTEANGPWITVATLDSYPDTTATDNAHLTEGQKFSVAFPPVDAVAIRVVGRPACGDQPRQAFSSCAELQAFAP
ncbi:MAG TPA: beta-L-arabinofuranosidase domain-containing protein [Armatimonadota bacterium]|jgi:hypothetical protein